MDNLTALDRHRFGGKRILVLERDNWRCVECGMTQNDHIFRFRRSLTVDHIDNNGRNSKVKNNAINNLQTLCLICHGKKDHKLRKHWGKRPDRVGAPRGKDGKFIKSS